MQTQTAKLDFKKYREWVAQGISYSEIRKDLAGMGYTDAEISRLIRTIDNEVQLELQKKSRNNKALGLMGTGAILFLLGTVITLLTFLGDSGSYILCYGAIGSGGASFLAGWHMRE